MAERFPLSAMLSWALIAFTIECDNEAEHRLPHTTTACGDSGGHAAVWMTSIAMWFNCLRGLSEHGPLTVLELERRVRMGTNLDGMRRWGYVTIDGVGRIKGTQKRPRANAESVLALTDRGQAAADVLQPLPAEIEGRWRERFGAAVVDGLRAALIAIAEHTVPTLPDFMPIGSVHGVGIPDAVGASDRTRGDDERIAELPLISLLSRVLLTFALDYERNARLSLCVQCNGLRVLSADGVALTELPARTGVSKAAITMVIDQLRRIACVELVSLAATRGKLARLTADRGVPARAAGSRRLARILESWRERFGERAVAALGQALEPIVGDGTRGSSPLFGGLRPYPNGWRAKAPQPQVLPWFPMVLHRGGYPDGS